MKRDEIVMSLLPQILSQATGLGTISKQEREEVFRQAIEIMYEIADLTLVISKETAPKE